MSFRALIIGIESYAQVQDGSIASELPGTLQAAFDFRDWLTQKWNKEGVPAAAQQILFCSSPIQPGGLGASYDAIMDALITLAKTGQNATKELYVFFSGHGFSYVRPDGSSDILIASDFVKSTRSGNVCFNLDKVIDWLRMHLGPGRHYYFIDACRTALTSAQIVPGELTLPSNPQTSGEPSTYVLQSTGRGDAAAADNRFAEALLAGLKGKGKAKVWDDAAVDTMMVRYDRLCIFLRETFKPQKIYSTVKGSDFASDGVLAILKPAPTAKCTVKLDGGEDRQTATVNCIGRRNATPIKRQIAGHEAEIELKPDRYTITIQMTEPLSTSAQHVELYDDITLTFQLSTAATPSSQDSTDETLSDIIIPQGVTVELQDSLTGNATEFRHSDRTSMPSGRYRATVRDNQNRVIGRKEYEIEGPAAAVIDVADWRHSVPHMAIANFLPQYDGGVDFSEALGGPVTDPDLDIWLAILGGGRILGARGDYSKIERFPLRDFSTETAGSSPTYVLAGFEEPSVDLEVGVSQGDAIVWQAATEPSAMSGIKECYVPTKRGPKLISLRLNGGRSYTIASFASPNRATLITVTLGPNQEFRIGQYLLPMAHLVGELDTTVAIRLEYRNQLLDVEHLARLMRAFRNRRDISKEVSDAELAELLYAKWLDPISTAMAAYELIRRGRMELMDEVVRNMSAFFPDLPDTPALTALRSGKPGDYIGAPLFLDGLRAFADIGNKLPLPEAKLDYNSPWTAWGGATT